MTTLTEGYVYYIDHETLWPDELGWTEDPELIARVQQGGRYEEISEWEYQQATQARGQGFDYD